MTATTAAACVLGLLWLLTAARNITLTRQRDNLVVALGRANDDRARLDLALPTGSETPLFDGLAGERFRAQLDAWGRG